MKPPFSRITLVGMGLMGGSLARSLKALPEPPILHGTSRDPQELEEALKGGTLDGVVGPEDPLPRDQDLVVYATPLSAALTLMERHGDQLRESSALISDLVSLKGPLLNKAEELHLQERYVGSHPMAGGTGSGFSHAREGLFSHARVWIIPGMAGESRIRAVELFWEMVGARPVRIEARKHDDRMAWVSHLPQLISNALARSLAEEGLTPPDLGPGGLDMTRLAASSPKMWLDLLERAPEGLVDGLSRMEETIAEIRRLVADGNVDGLGRLMDQTRSWREGP